jgi:very-short-patch-repair endonuclease
VAKLVIELDGGQHAISLSADELRLKKSAAEAIA